MKYLQIRQSLNCRGLFCVAVIPAHAIQLAGSEVGTQGLQTLTMTNAAVGSTTITPASAAIVQYAQAADGQLFIPSEFLVSFLGPLCGARPRESPTT